MKSPRDSQRSKVYDAERAAFPSTYDGTLPRLTIDECQRFVDGVCSSPTIREQYGYTRAAPTIVAGHGNRDRGCYKQRENEIHLPEWTRVHWYVLHELAHALVPPTSERPAHGREWAACYVELLRIYTGRYAVERLTREFKARRVTWKPKRAYTISDAERERRRERARSLR